MGPTLEPADPAEMVEQPAARLTVGLPTSTPSTWVGAYVVAAVVGYALLRRSLRRFL